MKKVFILLFLVSSIFADDIADIENLINGHWESWNLKKYKDYISSVHSDGTMNGDSNGSFWYEMTPTVKGLTENRKPGDKSSFSARYIEIDILVPGKAAVAYYYLVGSYTLGGVTKNDYRTRVSQVFVTEKGKWKIKSGHFSPLHSGSGIPD
tara:strand:- start:131 stop:586 length:456 start_codon:yes stop_codon:yes gene_type:complete